jgi:hypothetical protein
MSEKKRIPITIEKINSSTFQLTKISSVDIAKISEKFSWLPANYKYDPKFRLLGIKGVKIRLVQQNGMFPSGLFNDVVDFIKNDLNKQVTISDDINEHFLSLVDFFKDGISDKIFSDFEFDGSPVILRDYQLGAVESSFENRNCLLNLSTGAGKCLGGNTKLKVKLPTEIIEKYPHLSE